MRIDDIAENIVSSFNAGEKSKLKDATMNMLSEIKIDESMFSIVREPYLVAKSLYFMLTQDYLTIEEQTSVIKLVYFSLLNNYLKNCDSEPGDAGFENLVLGCKLAIVLINMQSQYLMYSVIASQGYITPDTHLRNQALIFGGIAKEAEMAHYNFYTEDVINRYYKDIYKEIRSYLPTGSELAKLKENCKPVIEDIKIGIQITLYDYNNHDSYF